MKKRILSLMLCLAVMLSGMAPVFAVEEQMPEMPEQIVQTEQLSAAETESTETQETEAAEPEQLKNVQTATEVYVNPLYADVQSEADLNKPEDGISALAEEEYTSDESVLAANIRSGMENREETITLYYASEQEYDSTLLKKWVNLAFEETDVPTQGDYIRWVWGGYKASISYYQSGGTYYYTYTVTVTYYTTAEQETQVTQKVDELLNGFGFTSATPDYTKIKTIYDYICENVTYDHENLENEDYKLKYTAYAALINGTAVCQGYAVLLYRMLEEVDVDTRVISGTGNGGAHGWNITQLRGKYYDLDSTWDAGRSSYRYFLKCDANFGDHTRDEDYSSSEFYAAYPMDSADYVVQDGDLPAETNIVASGTCGENLTWTLDDEGTLTISGTGAMTDYNYGSDAPWYRHLASIKTIVIDDGVTSIGNYAFDNSDNAFDDISSLTSMTIGNSVTSIGTGAFMWCTKLTDVTMGNSVTSFGRNAFYHCNRLTSVEIPDSTVSIGHNAFAYCESLASVAIPESVTSIGAAPFEACIGLTSITVEQGNQNYCSDNGVLYDKAQTALIQYPAGKTDTSFVTPENVTSIGEGAFYDCDSLTSVTIPDGVTSIGNEAFSNSSNLASFVIPKSVTSIGDDAFAACESLTSIEIPSSVTSIGSGVFSWCESLTSVTIPDSVTSIGDYAFYRCSSLTSVTIPANVASIGEKAFGNGDALAEIKFNGDLPQINSEAFTNVTATAYYPSTWETVPASDEYGGNLTWVAYEVESSLAITTQPVDFTGKVGDTAKFTIEATGKNLTYQWQYANAGVENWQSSSQSGNKTAALSVPITEARDGQKYRCIVTDGSGNSITSDAAILHVKGIVKIISQPKDYTGAVGTTARFTIEAAGEGLTYQWQYQNVGATNWQNSSQSGNQTDTVSVPITAARDGQKYRCVVTDADGNKGTSKAATLIVGENKNIVITQQPRNYIGQIGDTAAFGAEAEGNGLTYQWQYQNVNSSSWQNSYQIGNKTFTLTVPITAARDGQKYRCLITDADGNQVITEVGKIIVGESQGITITSQPVDFTGKVGDTATFTIEAEGNSLTYQWQYCNAGVVNWRNSSQSGCKTDTISIPITEARNGQQYRCIVMDVDGNQITSNAVTLIVG